MEVTAELKGQGVYLAGETVQCTVTFRNTATNEDGLRVENLAWASAQIQSLCQFIEPNSRRKFSESVEASSSTSSLVGKYGGLSTHATSLQSTSLGEIGQHEISSTKPKILFCDIYLNPGEERCFTYDEVLPRHTPSTYHGRHIRYSHRLVVAAQRVNCAIATLRIPFRVIAILADDTASEDVVDDEDEEPSPRITNPFFVDEKDRAPKGPGLPEPANPRRVPTFYDIRNSTGRVGKLCLFRTWYRLGEDVVGIFDFSDSTVRCMQYLVSLMCEEKVLQLGHDDSSSTSSAISCQPVRLLAKENSQEFCFGYEQTHFRVPVPLHATPSFRLKSCHLSWNLKFEFVICSDSKALWDQPFLDEEDVEDEDETALGHEWNGPPTVPVETMTWTLPITILPANASSVAQSVQIGTKFCMKM